MRIELPKPHPAQKQIMDDKHRFVVVCAGRRFGKSLIAQTIATIQGLQNKRVSYITPTFRLAKTFFSEMERLIPSKLAKFNKSDLIISFITGGSIKFYTGEKLDNMRGEKFHFVFVDESAYLKNLESDWNNVIRPTLTDYKGRAMFISTPRGKDYFYSLFKRNNEHWIGYKFTTYANPFIPVEEIEMAKSELPRDVFEQEFMASPMDNQSNPFGIPNIERGIAPLTNNPVAFYGIDLARTVDWTVIVGLDENGCMCYFERFQNDWNITKQRLLDLTPPTHHGYIDSTGAGDVVFNSIESELQWLDGFKFNVTSKQNLIEGLQMAIHKDELTYNDETADELKVFEYTIKPGSRGIRYEARTGFHDDIVVSLALANQSRVDNKHFGHYSMTKI